MQIPKGSFLEKMTDTRPNLEWSPEDMSVKEKPQAPVVVVVVVGIKLN